MTHYDPIDASARAHWARLSPWRRRLFLFLRGVAAFMIFQGVLNWATILGLGGGAPSRFEMLPIAAQGAVVWGAIVSPVAGVGLWLRANWAVVFWMVAIFTQLVLAIWAPAGILLLIVALMQLALVVAYAVLSIRAARESDQD